MPVMYLVGDSTVDDNTPPFRGWGYAMRKWAAEGVEVRNLAVSGCSSRSFLNRHLFQEALDKMTSGDLLLIQFGHNDEKDDEERHTDPATTFPETLKIYLRAAAERGAVPVLCTPVSRRFFTGDGSLLYTHGEYAGAIRKLAEDEQVLLIDLEKMTRSLYLALGEEGTARLFVRLMPREHPDFPDGHDDRTHFNEQGAAEVASLVASALREWEVTRSFVRPV